jgi:hypothetical protein
MKHLIEPVVLYILEESREFQDWFTDDGWDDAAVEKALGMEPGSLTEEQANIIATIVMHDDMTNLPAVVAYHCTGSHVYVDAVKLAVAAGIWSPPVLSKVDLDHIHKEFSCDE